MKASSRNKLMNCSITALCCAVFSACALFVGCAPEEQGGDNGGTGGSQNGNVSVEGIPDRYTLPQDKIVVFSDDNYAQSGFDWAHGYSNSGGDSVFNCTWSRDNATVQDGVMSMSVTKKGDTYYGGEYRSSAFYSYGYYSVCMQAAKCSGVVSSFFTYTGPSDNNPWDEIDIEFLGNDTTKVQFNYYTSGKGGHEFLYNLGFDASQSFHEYGFDWQPDSITWYVDGKAVYRATAEIPVTATKIMMNVWNTKGHDEWAGALDESSLPATGKYKWIAFRGNA